MKLYRFQVVPESPWRTPWQSDTLAGMLCWACARTEGDNVLRQRILVPAQQGRPPFVLSDAFPGDWLPVPTIVRLADWPPDHRKSVKRAKWLTRESFARLQRGSLPDLSELIYTSGIHEYTQLRNSIGRVSDVAGEGGGLFPTREAVLGKDPTGRVLEYLTVYARVQEEFVDLFWHLLHELTQWGFGADSSVGKGQFRLHGELESSAELDVVPNTNGCIVLSTFQPEVTDPTDGAWETFTKYGKLAPDLGVENVFKRPMILFKPGACFVDPNNRGWLGRIIRAEEMLPPEVALQLESKGLSVVHWAFGLTVPLYWPERVSE